MKYETFVKTDKLEAKFKGQRALVVEYLMNAKQAVTIEDVVVEVEGKYITLLNPYAQNHGGVQGSARYHLRALRDLGMVKINVKDDGMPELEKPKKVKTEAKKGPAVVAATNHQERKKEKNRAARIAKLVREKGITPNEAANIVDGKSNFPAEEKEPVPA